MNDKKVQNYFLKRGSLLGFCLTALVFMGLFCSLPVKAQPRHTVYFFNPETNINNLASLKKEFDTYLSGFGPYRFQPFGDRETFEKNIARKENGIFLLSSWHYKKLKEKFSFKPVLLGTSKGKVTHIKILSAKKKINRIELLKKKKIASSGSEEYTRNILKMIFGEGQDDLLNSIKVLKVPKDIDALIAVGFGMASAALTTEASLSLLAEINKKQYKLLKPLASSEDLFLPVVAIMGKLNEDNSALLEILEKMGEEEKGKKKMNMLGLDGLKKLTPGEAEELER